jgi:hypothetical protein
MKLGDQALAVEVDLVWIPILIELSLLVEGKCCPSSNKSKYLVIPTLVERYRLHYSLVIKILNI